MKRYVCSSALLLAVACSSATFAAEPQAAGGAQPKPTFAVVYDRVISGGEKEVVDAAEAMPDDKFNFAPTGTGEFKGVRTFALQVKHIATVSYMVGSAILQEKVPVDVGNENGPANLTSKADVVKYLKDSFAYLHKAAGTLNESNILEQVKAPWGDRPMTRLSLITLGVSHPFDHYGQMVVYLRLNGIIPPASRGQ
jgi:uncharacterized damage-inducible protein DinB